MRATGSAGWPAVVPRTINAESSPRDAQIHAFGHREVSAVGDQGKVSGRHEIIYVVRARRGEEMREFRLDGRGRRLARGDWQVADEAEAEDD